MECPSVIDEEALELQQLEELDRCFGLLTRLQGLFLQSETLPKDDLNQASGRKCVLGVVGLKYHKYQKFFEVTPTGVEVVEPYKNPNTYIAAPVDSVIRVVKGVLDGDDTAFASEWARGKTKLVGEKRMHDGYVFSEIFRQLAHMIKRYKGGS